MKRACPCGTGCYSSLLVIAAFSLCGCSRSFAAKERLRDMIFTRPSVDTKGEVNPLDIYYLEELRQQFEHKLDIMDKAIKKEGILAARRGLLEPLPKTLLAAVEDRSIDVINGKRLPKACIVPSNCDTIGDLLEGDILCCYNACNRKTVEEHFAVVYLVMTLLVLGVNDDACGVEWLSRRANALPPTRLDVCLYWAFWKEDYNPEPAPPKKLNKFWKSSLPYWRKMLNGKNPIYRLIALKSVRHFETDDDNILLAYEKALEEQNTIFHVEAIAGLSELAAKGSKDAEKLIRNYLALKENDGTWLPDKSVISFAKEELAKLDEQNKQTTKTSTETIENDKESDEEGGVPADDEGGVPADDEGGAPAIVEPEDGQ